MLNIVLWQINRRGSGVKPERKTHGRPSKIKRRFSSSGSVFHKQFKEAGKRRKRHDGHKSFLCLSVSEGWFALYVGF